MEEFLKKELSTSKLSYLGKSGGCISDGKSYETDSGRVFVKYNTDDDKAKVMYEGEFAGLKALYNTQTVRVPNPMKVVEHPSRGWVFIMEHIDMRRLNRYQSAFGEQLARLHLHNVSLKRQQHSKVGGGEGSHYVDKFGFGCTTCCGFISMPNDWTSSWVEFYTNQRLQVQVDLIEKEYGDSEVRELWSQLQRKIPSFFEGVKVEPSLLHGDLWSGNAGENDEGPVTFDPASFYGHHEFDLAIADMFGGFTNKFYKAYHQLIPKSPGFGIRHKLYLLFHYLNHWNHFGTRYRGQSITAMRELLS